VHWTGNIVKDYETLKQNITAPYGSEFYDSFVSAHNNNPIMNYWRMQFENRDVSDLDPASHIDFNSWLLRELRNGTNFLETPYPTPDEDGMKPAPKMVSTYKLTPFSTFGGQFRQFDSFNRDKNPVYFRDPGNIMDLMYLMWKFRTFDLFTKDKNDVFFRDPGNPPVGKKGKGKGKKGKGKANRKGNRSVQPVKRRVIQMVARRRRRVESPRRGLGSDIGTNPQIFSGPAYSVGQTMVRASEGSIVIERTEPWYDLSASTDGIITSLPHSGLFNPGFTFPILRQYASLYDRYVIKELDISYIHSAAYSEAGRWILALDADPVHTMQNLQEMQNIRPNFSAAVNGSITCNIPRDWLEGIFVEPKWIREGVYIGSDYDPHFYDAFKINIARKGCTGSNPLGTFMVHYKVELSYPHADMEPALYMTDKLVVTDCTVSAPYPSDTSKWTSTGYYVDDNKFSLTGWYVNSDDTLKSTNTGQFLFIYKLTGTTLTATSPTMTTTSVPETKMTHLLGLANSAATSSVHLIIADVQAQLGDFTISFVPSANTVTALDLRIVPYTYSYAIPGPIVDKICIETLQDDPPEVNGIEFKEDPQVSQSSSLRAKMKPGLK